LSAAEVRQVEAALARYQAARAELEAQAQAGLARLRGRLGDRPGGGRPRGGTDPGRRR
jgi:outer membrane protein TolC